MKTTTEFVCLRTHYGYKWPKLVELYTKLLGTEFDNLHNALADVGATIDCYYKL